MRSDLDMRGIRKIYQLPEVGKALLVYAESAAAKARRSAPFQSGAYRKSIHARPGRFGRFQVAYLAGEDRKSYFLERGSHDRHGGWGPHQTLTNAARQAGLRVVFVDTRGIGAV